VIVEGFGLGQVLAGVLVAVLCGLLAGMAAGLGFLLVLVSLTRKRGK
jgi:hypothetical protein